MNLGSEPDVFALRYRDWSLAGGDVRPNGRCRRSERPQLAYFAPP